MEKCLRRGLAALLAVVCLTADGVPALAKPAVTFKVSADEAYVIPPFMDSEFHEDEAEDFDVIRVDMSALPQGYIGIQAESDARLKFQVACGEMKYTYNIHNDGTSEIIPLNMGDGEYSFYLMENVVDTRYACTWQGEAEVEMEDEFQCFLRPSQMSRYTEESECVLKARELAKGCKTDIEIVAAIYKFLTKTIKYDYQKAKTVNTGYLPYPDETLQTKKGICFDYASLACAMMRSLGIPCKLITGYVDGELYHAWNTFYLENTGWVTVGIEAPSFRWQRIDITLAASGTSTKDLTDDGKYTTRYEY